LDGLVNTVIQIIYYIAKRKQKKCNGIKTI